MSSIREKILDALGTIPETLEQANELIDLYHFRWDPKLEQKATELSIALLVSVEHMIEWMDENVFSKPMS